MFACEIPQNMDDSSAYKLQSDNFLKVDTSGLSSPSPIPASPSLSATTPTALTPTPGNSLSRRPSRKSTLTQQQKNQKRQRATQDQLTTLENEFLRNPTPTASVRERIAEVINMTERSVQIWFQNRRAKIKNMAKKSMEHGEECELIPESMRRYLALQALESGKSFMRGNMLNGDMTAYGSGTLLDTDSSASKVIIYHLACRSLSIGNWQRNTQTQLDLVVFYSPVQSMMTYYIQADGSGYKMEYPFSYIKNITLDMGDVTTAPDGTQFLSGGGLVIELTRPPMFSVDQGNGGWFQCGDFSQDEQASQVMVHHLGGQPKVLSGQLAKLVSLDAYQHRHSTFETMSNHLAVPVVDPIGFRPASQPNHVVHPRANMFPSLAFDLGPPARGHKRQRSRSVPVAIDFSQFRPAKVPFMMHQHHHMQSHNHMADSQPRIFAPVPQHAQPHPLQQQHLYSPPSGPLGPTLKIDTASGYGMDFPPCPPSTASGASPQSTSEYEPSMLATAPASDTFALSHAGTPFVNPFMSPMSESTAIQHPMTTPLTAQSHTDSLLTLQTPETPLLHRSAATSARPSLQLMEDEKFDFSFLDTKSTVPALDMNSTLDQQPSSSQNSDTSFNIPQLSLTMDDQKWLNTELSQKPFNYDSDALVIQDELLYDSYLTDPLGDPFLDQLSEPMLHHPLQDSIIESFHRRHKSKPSISTLPFRTFGEGPASSSAASQQAPSTQAQHVEEFNFGHMVHCSEDFGRL